MSSVADPSPEASTESSPELPPALRPEELAGLMRVLQHPEHTTGLDDRTLEITSIAKRAERLVRVTGRLSGDDELTDWSGPNVSVRLQLPEPPEEFAAFPGVPPTTPRVYTIADTRLEERLVDIDLVHHDAPSPAMRWLASVRPGDRIGVVGPRPHRVPGPGSPRMLLADSSALPAALSIVRTMPADGPTIAIVAAPDDEIALFEADARAALGDDLTIVRADPAPGAVTPLAAVFASLDVPAGASVWAGGERDDLRELRRRCRDELALPRECIQVFGYWRRGVSNTRIDLERLRAVQQNLAAGRAFDHGADDDLDLAI